ncbi:hypothetical protein SEA_JSQUARED_78 [Mycobacterium phage Jsquared]|nr:hypothetical protein SEA_JSQUARED_78 [Mycobacterium phage Jsquared]
MPLTRLAKLFADNLVHTSPQVIADHPGWLFAQRCETWWQGHLDEDPVSVLLVYRSPRVKDTSRLYRPVSNLILGANKVEYIAQGTRFDPTMIHCDKGTEWTVLRMTQADQFPKDPIDMSEVGKLLSVAVDGALNDTIGKGRMAPA